MKRDKLKRKVDMTALRMHRRAKGMTLRQLSGRIGCSLAAVSAWETGRASPNPNWVPKLARALGVEPLCLMKLMNPAEEKVNA